MKDFLRGHRQIKQTRCVATVVQELPDMLDIQVFLVGGRGGWQNDSPLPFSPLLSQDKPNTVVTSAEYSWLQFS